jgi:hypothetical protein
MTRIFFRMAFCKDAVSFETKGKGASMELTFLVSPKDGASRTEEGKTPAPRVIRNPYEFPSKPILRAYGSGKRSSM